MTKSRTPNGAIGVMSIDVNWLANKEYEVGEVLASRAPNVLMLQEAHRKKRSQRLSFAGYTAFEVPQRDEVVGAVSRQS